MYIGESGEDYLEAIFILHRRGGNVRNVELAAFMNHSKPSITNAVKELKKRGLAEKLDNGQILLTEEGFRIASKIYERHCFFKSLLIEAGVDETKAQSEACRMEHSISQDSFVKLRSELNKLRALEIDRSKSMEHRK